MSLRAASSGVHGVLGALGAIVFCIAALIAWATGTGKRDPKRANLSVWILSDLNHSVIALAARVSAVKDLQ